MATRAFTAAWHREGEFGAAGITWTGLLDGDDGAPWEFKDGPITYTATISGAFGTGGTVLIEHSADGITWGTMIQVNNSAASFTAATSAALRGSPRYIRPRISAGTGVTVAVALHLARGVSVG